MSSSTPEAYFFGYGSLVNRDTHSFSGTHPAKLLGWRRVWRHTTLREVAYLTVIPDPSSVIDGLIAPVPHNDWQELDIRERAYDRISAAHQVSHPLGTRPDIAVYAIPPGKHDTPSRRHSVLLSYIDVVVQGYCREFGPDGVARFFATTDGWEAPIINDRATPRYPRSCRLTPAQTRLVNDHLAQVNARIVSG